MRRKQMAVRWLWILLFALLAACSAAPTPKMDDAAGTKIVATFMAQITQTAAAADDLPATMEPTETESPEETETPYASPAPDPNLALLSRFRTVTVSQGNLYVRDGLGVPVQITKSGTDHDPVISSDGQKIAFYRGEGAGNIFIINADGTGEKDLINKTTLSAKTKTKVLILSPSFRPGTAQLVFSTFMCEDTKCEMSVFVTETEALKLTVLAKGLPGQRNLDEYIFNLSPDGQYMIVKNTGQLDLHSMDGKIVRANIAGGTAQVVYWMPDSSGLIVLRTWFGDGIWRYTLKDQRIKTISLDPDPGADKNSACYLSVSPDRNWFFYQDHDQKKQLVSLKIGKTRYDWAGNCSVSWSLDSQHFASQTAIGSVDGTPPIPIDGHFIAWLDATHYLFSKGKTILDLQSYIAEVGKESAAAPTNFIWSPVYAVMEPTPVP